MGIRHGIEIPSSSSDAGNEPYKGNGVFRHPFSSSIQYSFQEDRGTTKNDVSLGPFFLQGGPQSRQLLGGG